MSLPTMNEEESLRLAKKAPEWEEVSIFTLVLTVMVLIRKC